MKKKTNKSKGKKIAALSKYDEKVLESRFTDKKSFKINLSSIETLYSKAKEMNKSPMLIIGIVRNTDELFVLKCEIILERKEHYNT